MPNTMHVDKSKNIGTCTCKFQHKPKKIKIKTGKINTCNTNIQLYMIALSHSLAQVLQLKMA